MCGFIFNSWTNSREEPPTDLDFKKMLPTDKIKGDDGKDILI